ncbi:histone-like nucleoid-structuring protein Lsr2 [Amycolatopsis nigrescens]|uniref:histone-like nucleoid-structuring protein Lsr2 n=1 Tax=Amycolatopsis nigrescens TaxID=381445 RepID=UPI00047614DF|nr:Lsr2 family protein [Amycolatopsis nigrescens]
MAQQVRVEMLDDLDGSVASQTVPFTLDGVHYEIDLSDGNAAELRDELAKYVAAGRRTGGRKIRGAGSKPADPGQRDRNREIRVWANANGYQLAERGRIAAEVVAAFDDAQRKPVAAKKTAAKRAPKKKAVSKKVS